jgi:hypothetical protein
VLCLTDSVVWRAMTMRDDLDCGLNVKPSRWVERESLYV